MIFQWPSHLVWLLLPGALYFAALWESKKRRQALERFAGTTLVGRYIPAGLLKRQSLKTWLTTAALALLVIAWAGPRYGKTLKEIKRQGSDVLICVDVSTSMLAEDIAPDRITKAKRDLSELIDNLKGDRVGIVSFAGTSFLQCPLTTDLDAATMYLDLLDPTSFPVPGTDIGSAISLAAHTLQSGGHSAVVLLTDGEDFGSDTAQAIKEAADKNIRVYCIGFGTPQGELIKIRDSSGKVTGFKKDEKGETVVSRLDEDLLSKISQQTGGRYFPASNGDIEVEELAQEIRGLKKENMGTEELSQMEHRFQIPLFLAFLCAFIELLIPEKTGLLKKWGWRKIKLPLTLSVFLLCLASGKAQAGFQEDINIGNKKYQKAQWADALSAYRNAEAENPGSGIASYNIGNTLYRTGQFDDALTELSRSTGTLMTPRLRAAAYYNRGNAYARMGKNTEAIEEYKKALLLYPGDEDAKFNLEFLKRGPPQCSKCQNPSGKSSQNKNDKDKRAGSGEEKNKGDQGAGAKNPEALSREDAERLLNTMKEQEKQQFEAQQNSKPVPERSPKGKDW